MLEILYIMFVHGLHRITFYLSLKIRTNFLSIHWMRSSQLMVMKSSQLMWMRSSRVVNEI
jgi:hypothetical protein